MSVLTTPVMEPQATVGTGNYVPAVKRMELGALTPVSTRAWAFPVNYAIPTYVVNPTCGASLPRFSAPVMLLHQHVSADYLRQYVIDPAQGQQALADRLADILEHDSEPLSVIRRAARNPVFSELQELGGSAVGVALDRLRGRHRPLWLFFLQRVTGERVARNSSSVDDAAAMWRRWGAERGFV
jgi:hypothetical protein